MSKVKVGDQAPDFSLPSSGGENVSLSQFRLKKNVVLFFYPMDESLFVPGRQKLSEIVMVHSKN